jgi:uncharacterized protein (DUF58 family)
MNRALSGLTRRGRYFLLIGLVLTTSAIMAGSDDLLRIGILLLVLPAISLLVALRSRIRLAATRSIEPRRTPVGTTTTVRLILQNLARIPTGVLLVEDALPYTLGNRPRFVLDRVWSRFRREVRYGIRADLRGRYTIGPLALRVTDPFGLVELRRSFTETGTLIVTPAVMPLPNVRLAGEWSGSGESRPRSIASAGEEDVTIRSYRQGDDIRRVHWPATAHHNELMVRREEQPWQSRATLLLDTRVKGHAGHGPDSSLEWAVTATASVGVHLARRGYAIRLLTDEGAAISGAWHSAEEGPADAEAPLLDALAVVQASRAASVGQWPSLLAGADAATGLLIAIVGQLRPAEAEVVARMRHGSTAALAIMLDAASWTSLSPHARQQEDVRIAESEQILRRAGWGVATAGRQDAMSATWERLGVRRRGDALARPGIVRDATTVGGAA